MDRVVPDVMRQKLHAAVLLACFWAGGNVGAQPASQQAALPDASPHAMGAAAAAPNTEAIRDSIAGPLIQALSARLGGRAVELRLDVVDVRTIGADERAISGSGDAQVVGTQGWIDFRFGLRYDGRLRRTSYPEVSIDGVAAGERDLLNDPHLVQRLEAIVIADMARELRKPSAWLRLDSVSTVQGDGRHLRIDARGTAYLDRYGPGTPLTVVALYDRSSDAWLKLEYGPGQEASNRVWDRRLSSR
ncbi:hypothetical protein [Lysobacter sp. CCNWLW3]|uniref:hypothetical protein n=2 Tax=Lysobacter TaxID=68 RepID=UPI002FD38845